MNMGKTASKMVCMVVGSMVLGLVVPSGVSADVNVLHTFSAGEHPAGLLTQSDSVLYGTTAKGSGNSSGTIFKINTDGTGFSVLHSFTGTDGSWPTGSLVQSGSVLYGMTQLGGSNGMGTIFKINTDGTGFSVLYSFAGGAADGSTPYGSLLLSESTLYGMTSSGGSGSHGVIFKINTDGTGFGLLHSFTGGSSDGASPLDGSLILSGTTLYGMTSGGGSNNGGVAFKINTDGTGFSLLYAFGPTAYNGPSGPLTLSGSTLYGTTPNDGANGAGTVFQITTDGTSFSVLRSFAHQSTTDGEIPQGALVQSGSLLFGATRLGGTGGLGTIYQINTDGTGFTLLHSFTGGNDGANPTAGVILSGSTLYGMTCTDNENGGIYSITVAIPTPTATPTPTSTPTPTPTDTPTPTPTPTPAADKVRLTLNVRNGGIIGVTTNKYSYGLFENENNVLEFDRGTFVYLEPEESQFWVLTNWEGDVTKNDCYQNTVVMDTDKTVTGIYGCYLSTMLILLGCGLGFGFLGRSNQG
jgi:uncharacterized repeat protein (TIGR03803 family)